MSLSLHVHRVVLAGAETHAWQAAGEALLPHVEQRVLLQPAPARLLDRQQRQHVRRSHHQQQPHSTVRAVLWWGLQLSEVPRCVVGSCMLGICWCGRAGVGRCLPQVVCRCACRRWISSLCANRLLSAACTALSSMAACTSAQRNSQPHTPQAASSAVGQLCVYVCVCAHCCWHGALCSWCRWQWRVHGLLPIHYSAPG